MTVDDDPLSTAVAEAAAWYRLTGWPSRMMDLTVARRVAASSADPERFLEALAQRFGPSGPGAVHRAVLCRLVMQTLGTSDPTAGDG